MCLRSSFLDLRDPLVARYAREMGRESTREKSWASLVWSLLPDIPPRAGTDRRRDSGENGMRGPCALRRRGEPPRDRAALSTSTFPHCGTVDRQGRVHVKARSALSAYTQVERQLRRTSPVAPLSCRGDRPRPHHLGRGTCPFPFSLHLLYGGPAYIFCPCCQDRLGRVHLLYVRTLQIYNTCRF
jgi:hypothetical protein